MPDAFDPYRTWLGIVSSSPNHYERLGLARFESEPPVIAEAAQRQMARLAPHLAGEHAQAAHELMSELACAKVVLLTPVTKRAYDAQLRAQTPPFENPPAARQGPVAGPPATPGQDPLLPPTATPTAAAPRPAPVATLVSPPYLRVPPPGAPPAPGLPRPALPPSPVGLAYVQPVAGRPAAAGSQVVAPRAAAPVASQPALPWALPEVAVRSGSPDTAALRSLRSTRCRKSSAPWAVGILLAAVLATAGITYALLNRPTTVAKQEPARSAPADARAAPAARRPLAGGGRRPGENRPRHVRTRPKPIGRPPLVPPSPTPAQAAHPPPDSSSVPPATQMPGPDLPAPVEPQPSEPAPPVPAPAEPEPTRPAPAQPEAGIGDPLPPEPEPADSPGRAAAVRKALAAARAALADRDLPAAAEQIDLATIDATSAELEAEVERARTLVEYLQGFWTAVEKGVAQLEGLEELEVNGRRVMVVEVKSDSIVVRAAGRNREYAIDEMPTNLAFALAESWLAQDDPNSKAFLGAFLAVDPKGSRPRSRQLLDEAASQGADIASLLEALGAGAK